MSADCDSLKVVLVYRCRKCRFNLEITDAVLESDIGNCDLSKTTIDLEPDVCPSWILDAVNQSGWTKGKLKCEKCSGRLGSFDFVKDNTCEGQNGRHQHSAVHLNRDRVDVLKTSSRSASSKVKDLSMGKLTSCYRETRILEGPTAENVGNETKESIDNITNDVKESDNIPLHQHIREFDGNLAFNAKTVNKAHFIQSISSSIPVHEHVVDGKISYENKLKHRQSTDQRLQGQTIESYGEADEKHLSYYNENTHSPDIDKDILKRSYADSVKCDSVLNPTKSNSESTGKVAIYARSTQGDKIFAEKKDENILENCDSNFNSLEINNDIREDDLVAYTLVVPNHENDNLKDTNGKVPIKPANKSQTNLKTICDKMDALVECDNAEPHSGQKGLRVINFESVCDKMDSYLSENRDENSRGISDINTYFEKSATNSLGLDNEHEIVQERFLDREYFQDIEYDSRRKCVISNGENDNPGMSGAKYGSSASNDMVRRRENRFEALDSGEPSLDEDTEMAEQEAEEIDPHEEEIKRRRSRRRSEKRQRQRFRRRFGYVYGTGPVKRHQQEDDTDYSCPPIEQLLEEEDVPNEMSCPVCLEILFSPYKCRPCNHVFCEICLRRIAKQQPNCTLCPMCRKVIRTCVSDIDLGRQLCEEYPRLYKRRQAEMQRSKVHTLPLPRSSWRENAFRNVSFRIYNQLFVPVLVQILRPGVWRFIPACCFFTFVFGLITMLCFIVLICRFMLRSTYEFAVNIFS